MQFTIVIQAAPASSQASASALAFARAVLASGHGIYRLFFYQDGVNNASGLVVPPQDEVDLPRQWQTLITHNSIDAVVCAASALKRGILDADEARRYERAGGNLLAGFTIGGLGQLIDACLQSDRVVSFVP